MVSGGQFLQAYNCQAAVDDKAQIVVAADVTQEADDKNQMTPMVNQIRANMGGTTPKHLTADTGYFNQSQVDQVQSDGVDLYVATTKQKHGTPIATCPRGRIPKGRNDERQNGEKASHTERSLHLLEKKTDHRTRVWTDQIRSELHPILIPPNPQSHQRMEPDLSHTQPSETLSTLIGYLIPKRNSAQGKNEGNRSLTDSAGLNLNELPGVT